MVVASVAALSPNFQGAEDAARRQRLGVQDDVGTQNAAKPQHAVSAEQGQISTSALRQIEAIAEIKRSLTPAQRRIDSQLILARKQETGELAALNLSSVQTGVEKSDEGKVLVDITADVTDAFLNMLRTSDADIVAAVPNYRSVRAKVALSQLEAIASFQGVKFIQPAQKATTWSASDRQVRVTGDLATRAARVEKLLTLAIAPAQDGYPVTVRNGTGERVSEGDRTHEADRARGTFNVDGTGIKIGVLSDGVEGLAESQARGELPGVTVLPGQFGPYGSEGTAMLEIVHDIAPGAQLFFATAFTGPAQFAQNISDLRAAGCDIIVDDVFYFLESPFQDGQAPAVISTTNGAVITQAVNDVTNDGALYFSSAGNAGNLNDNTAGVWEGDFNDGGAATGPVGAGQVHEFTAHPQQIPAPTPALFNQILASSGEPINLFWSDPLGASANDYDLYVLDASGTVVLGQSVNTQDGTQDPAEQVAGSANNTNNRVVVVKFSGAARYLHVNSNQGWLRFVTPGQTKGHSTAALAYSTAATNAIGPYPGIFNSVNEVERFESDGPRRLFYNGDGTPKTPGNFSSTGGELRQKPDVTAADGVSVTGVSLFGSPFFGTSAAVSHGGAIAALLKQAQPTLTQAQIRTALTSTAIDIEAPGTDRDSGAGIIMPFAALQAAGATGFANLDLSSATPAESGGNVNGFIEAGENGTLSVQLENTGLQDATGVTATLTTSTPGVVISDTSTRSFPDIPMAGTGANISPYAFTITSGAGCPQTVDFTLTINSTGRPEPKVINFTLFTGPGANISETLNAVAPSNDTYYTATTGTQVGRLIRDGLESHCGFNKTFPGLNDGTNRRFDSYTFPNTSPETSCVTVRLVAPLGINIHVVAYGGTFNPADLSSNSYLGDTGSTSTVRQFSVRLPANTNLVVVVNDVSTGVTADIPYTLEVTGINPPCAAAPANQPPVNTVPGAQNTNENTALYFSSTSGNQISVSDPDAGNNPLQVTLTATNGAISLIGTTGLTFTDGDGTNDTTMTFSGTQANINTALNGLAFEPPPGSTAAASLTITTNDQGFTGSGGALSDTDIVNITVNAGGTLQFSSAAYNIDEGDDTATITVTRTGGSSGSTTVTYNVSDGTAGQQDYISFFTGTLTFADGEMTQTFEITITEDALAESDETVDLTLSDVTGTATLGPPAAAVLIIRDNDRVEFLEPTYTIEEGCTGVDVTVARTGNISSAAAVNYATIDGTASARSDYTPAFGSLDFAAGETSKTVTILISEDSRVEGTETFSVVLSNAGAPSTDVVASADSTTVISITDDAIEPSTNAIDDTATFVCQHYHDFLNREPDAAGQAFWVNNIDSCGTAACKAVKRIETSAAFFLSIEFQQTGYAVYLAHQAAFAGSPVPVTLEDFLPDVQGISRGVIIGQPGALAQLEANTVAYFNEFVTRPQFTTQYPSSMTPAQFVDELNANSGGSLSQSERDALVAELTANNTTAGRASVLRQVTNDSDFRSSEFNRAFVLMQYFGYLRRNPYDTPDTDYAGFFFWLNKLDSFNGDFRAAEMVKAFITSAEYRQRFGTN